MFGFFKSKKDKSKPPSAPDKKPTREELLELARKNAAAARAEIGDETLEKIKQAMMKKQASALEQAKKQVGSLDKGKVADHIKIMMDEDKK